MRAQSRSTKAVRRNHHVDEEIVGNGQVDTTGDIGLASGSVSVETEMIVLLVEKRPGADRQTEREDHKEIEHQSCLDLIAIAMIARQLVREGHDVDQRKGPEEIEPQRGHARPTHGDTGVTGIGTIAAEWDLNRTLVTLC